MNFKQEYKYKVTALLGPETEDIFNNAWRAIRKLGCDSFFDGANFLFKTRRTAKQFIKELGIYFDIEKVN